MNYIIWGANLSGGFLRADVEQERDNSFTYNQKLVELAEKKGINAILYATRYLGAIGGSESEQGQLDPLTLMAAYYTKIDTIKALLTSAEIDGEVNEQGVYVPASVPLQVARNLGTEYYPRMIEILKGIGANGVGRLRIKGRRWFITK